MATQVLHRENEKISERQIPYQQAKSTLLIDLAKEPQEKNTIRLRFNHRKWKNRLSLAYDD